ncbi:MAG: hypothetical protein HY706_20720 [Candidatus Hydrogenedentes bacterium]|nr:hypothetical protein [Candidatus Hydrogenedentota bacterium]
MKTKIEHRKAFDCVEFKRRSQARLRKEYQVRQGEFASYADFLRAKVGENKWSKGIWETIARNK